MRKLLSSSRSANWTEDDPAAEVTTQRPFNPNVSSPEAFELAKHWLTECLTSHPRCSIDAAPPPSRLLKIHLLDGDAPLELLDMRMDQRVQWCNLSYVWGGVQTVMTTRKGGMIRSIPIISLPPTMRDAVTVARSLGIGYIWIDSLCIVQDDSDDMPRQLAAMPRIYQDAVLTIFASAAQSVQEGFLYNRGYDYTTLEPFSLRYRSSDGSRGKLILLEIEEYIDWRTDYPEPIDTRGWCYQEQQISTRCLIFSRKQVRWACHTCQRTDGGVDPTTKFNDLPQSPSSSQAPSMTQSPTSSQAPSLSRSPQSPQAVSLTQGSMFPPAPGLRRSPRPSQTSSSSQDTISTEEELLFLWNYWTTRIREYSTRKLTKPEDKLRAIAALARMCSARSKTEYVAGLWKEHFPQALCWSAEFGVTFRPTVYRAPSWSWAAVEGEIGYSGALNRFYDYESLVDIEVTLPPDATFEAVSAGTLTIKGKMATAKWFFNTGEVIVEGHEMMAFPDFREEQWDDRDEESLDVQALLLMKERNFVRSDDPNWHPVHPDGDWRGLLLAECEHATYRRMAQFGPAAFQTPYMFSDREPQEVRII